LQPKIYDIVGKRKKELPVTGANNDSDKGAESRKKVPNQLYGTRNKWQNHWKSA